MTSVSVGHIILTTDPTSRERAATAGIEPGSSSPGVARSTTELPRPPGEMQTDKLWQKERNGLRQREIEEEED